MLASVIGALDAGADGDVERRVIGPVWVAQAGISSESLRGQAASADEPAGTGDLGTDRLTQGETVQ